MESRFATRALRGTAAYRNLLTVDLLVEAAKKNLKDESLTTLMAAALDTKVGVMTVVGEIAIPEVELFLGLLTVTFLSDQKSFVKVWKLSSNFVGSCAC